MALLFRFVNFHDVHHIEVALMCLFAAFAHYLCNMLALSGIMGLFVAARTIGHHAAENMSRTARDTAPFVFKTVAAVGYMIQVSTQFSRIPTYTRHFSCCIPNETFKIDTRQPK